MITLYEFRASPYCAKVRKLLDYKKLAFTAVEVSFLARAEPKRLSGQGRVPVIQDGDKVVSDSTAIAVYLEERYPSPAALPQDAAERARVLLLEDWADEAFAGSAGPAKLLQDGNAEVLARASIAAQGNPFLLRTLAPLAGLVLRTYARRRRAAGRDIGRIVRDFGVHLDLLDAALAGAPFLAGPSPTVADFAVYGFLSTMEGLEGFDDVSRRARLWDWYGRVKAL